MSPNRDLRSPTGGLNAEDSSIVDVKAAIEEDIESLFRKEAPHLTRYFRERLRDGDDPGDLVQTSFVRLVGSLAQRAMPTPGAYLQRIPRKLLLDRHTRAEARPAPSLFPT